MEKSRRSSQARRHPTCASGLFAFQHKERMAEHRTLKLLKRRVHGDAKGASEGVAAPGFFLQKEGCLPLRQFSCLDRFRATPTREGGLSCCPQIAHPIHYSKRGTHIALAIVRKYGDRDGTWLPAFAPTHGEQIHRVVSNDETRSYQWQARTQQGGNHHICHTHKPGSLVGFCHIFLLILSLMAETLDRNEPSWPYP